MQKDISLNDNAEKFLRIMTCIGRMYKKQNKIIKLLTEILEYCKENKDINEELDLIVNEVVIKEIQKNDN